MSVAVNATNFPDENFRQYVLKYITSGSTTLTDEMIAEIDDIGGTDSFTQNCVNLKGIEYFTNLEHLSFGKNLQTVDLSKNVKLKRLDNSVSCCSLASLDLSKNVNLVSLSLSCCLTSLDLSKNIKLETLNLLSQFSFSGTDIVTTVKEDGDYYVITDTLDMKTIVGSGNISRVSVPDSSVYGLSYTYKSGQYQRSQSVLKSVIETTTSYGKNVYRAGVSKTSEGYYATPFGGTLVDYPNVNGFTYYYDTKLSKSSPAGKNGHDGKMPVQLIMNPYMTMAFLPQVKVGEKSSIQLVIASKTDNSSTTNFGLGSNIGYKDTVPTTPVKFSIVKGSLPSGLSLNATTGLISGTPK